MKLPITGDTVSCGLVDVSPRPVPRLKRSLGTSLCPGASASWALRQRESGPYQFSHGCFCLSPEQHGAQFRQADWDLRSVKGQC
jgi:hypothetical protein